MAFIRESDLFTYAMELLSTIPLDQYEALGITDGCTAVLWSQERAAFIVLDIYSIEGGL